jgi:hypothetical protein
MNPVDDQNHLGFTVKQQLMITFIFKCVML